MIVTKDTTIQELETEFQKFLDRKDIGIVFIAQSLAEKLRNMIIEHQENEDKLLPTVMEIPSKDSPYDPSKDTMLVQAASRLFGQEAGMEKLKN